MYRWNTITQYDTLIALEEQWSSLLECAVYDSFFCSHGWICCWWENFALHDDKLAVVTVEKQGELVAVAPLMIRTHREYGFSRRVLRFIGTPNADRCDVIIARGREDIPEKLAEYIYERLPGWDQLHLNEVPEESLFANWLMKHASRVFVEPGSECPYIPLANWNTWDDYYASLSRNTRKLANRKGNRLNKEGLSRYFYKTGFQEEHFFRNAGLLEQTSEKASRIKHLVLGDEQQYTFQKQLAKRSNLYSVLLVGLERDGEMIAYLYGFIYKNKYYAYNTAYAPEQQKHSPGLLVFRETIKYCKEQGIEEFDFLRGPMQIKKHWAKDRIRKQLNVYWLKNKPVNWLYAGAVFSLRPFLKKHILSFLRKN